MTKGFGGLILSLLLVGACSGEQKNVASDPYAGLDEAIRAWKTEIVSSGATCRPKAPDQKCEMFEIACKAQRVITSDEQANGVTAKLVADITWNGFDEKGVPRPDSAAAEFSKANGTWTRRAARPVNPSTCADI